MSSGGGIHGEILPNHSRLIQGYTVESVFEIRGVVNKIPVGLVSLRDPWFSIGVVHSGKDLITMGPVEEDEAIFSVRAVLIDLIW